MKILLAGGMYSFVILVWAIISIAISIIFYKRLPKQMLIIIGTLLGSILFSIGTMTFFSGLTNIIRTIGETATPNIQFAINEGINYARIPFSFATVVTILYFIVISILIALKKQPFKKWSIWGGFFIFFLLSFAPAFYRQTMNTRLLRGVGKIMGHGDAIPPQILPIVRAGRMAVITAFALLMVYLFIAILSTIHKRRIKPAVKEPEVKEAEKPPIQEEPPPQPPEKTP